MMQIDMPEIKPELAGLLKLLEQQETGALLITRNGKPLARLLRPSPEEAGTGGRPSTVKRIGVAKGKFTVPDDFDKWDDEVAGLFEGYM